MKCQPRLVADYRSHHLPTLHRLAKRRITLNRSPDRLNC